MSNLVEIASFNTPLTVDKSTGQKADAYLLVVILDACKYLSLVYLNTHTNYGMFQRDSIN